MQKYSTLVFDLDGTLSDPLEGFMRSINHALREHGEPERERAELCSRIGPPLDETVALLLPGAELARQQSLITSYRERYGRLGYAENTLYPHVAETLAALTANGIRMGVCTSKRADFAEAILKLFGIRQHFAFVSGGGDGIRKGSQLADLLRDGQIDRQALMIGDRKHDLLAARENGLACCGVRWGYGSEEELQHYAPDHLLDSPQQWLALAAS